MHHKRNKRIKCFTEMMVEISVILVLSEQKRKHKNFENLRLVLTFKNLITRHENLEKLSE